MATITRQLRRQLGGRLHGQPGDGLSLGDRARATSASRSTTCCPPGTRSPARWRRPACSPPSATGRRTGEGQLVNVALSDVAFAMVGNLGKIAEAQVCRRERQKEGNYLYGAFGRDFQTKDGRRVMVVALTPHQWQALVDATGLQEAFELVERQMDVDLSKEGDRFRAREVLGSILKPWTITAHAGRDRRDLRSPRRLLGPVPDVHAAGRRGPALLDREPDVRRGRAARDRQLPDGRLAACTSPSEGRLPATRAPALGEHTDEILAGLLSLERRRDRAPARRRRRRRPDRRRGLSRAQPPLTPGAACWSISSCSGAVAAANALSAS